MKKFSSIVFSIIFTIISLALFSNPTYAAQFKVGDYTLEQDTIIEEDLYVKGDIVNINGIVDGDLFLFGNKVSIDGTVTGDLVVGAEIADISGNVYGNTFVMAQNSQLSGIIGENLFLFAMSTDYQSETGEDVYGFVGTGTLSGSVGDDLRMFGGQIGIDSLVKGDALISSTSHTIDEEKITGNYYNQATLENIYGEWETNYKTPEFKISNLNTTFSIFGFVGMYIVGAVFIFTMPVKTYKIKEKITGSTSDFFKSLLVGLAIFIFIPLPIILLLISLVGAPIAILISGFLLFIMIFGKLWVETAFGEEILELIGYDKKNYYLSLLVGRVLSVIVSFIPIVRGFYSSILTMTALGAIVRMKLDNFKNTKVTPKKTTKTVAKKTPVKKNTTKKTTTKRTTKK